MVVLCSEYGRAEVDTTQRRYLGTSLQWTANGAPFTMDATRSADGDSLTRTGSVGPTPHFVLSLSPRDTTARDSRTPNDGEGRHD